MKKILFTCFLGILYPFPNRSRSNPLSFGTYLSDEGAVFLPIYRDYFTAKGGISLLIGGLFPRRSRSISQGIALPISRYFFPLILLVNFGNIVEASSQVDGSTLLNQEGMIYLELSSSQAPDSLSFKFWDHLVSERMNVTPGTFESVGGEEGNMFEGSRGFQVYNIPLPPDSYQNLNSHGFFSIHSGRDELIRQWIYFPEDRVRIRVDLSNGTLLFGGPSADFYRLQYELDRVFKEEQFNANPILFSSNPEFYQSDSLSEKLWLQLREKPEDLYVKMQVIQNAEEGWQELEKYWGTNWLEHPAIRILDRYTEKLSPDQLNLIEASIKGRILFAGINKADLAWTAIQQDPKKRTKLQDWVNGFFLQDQQFSHPLLAQALFQYSIMEAQFRQSSMEEVYGNLPNPLREEIIAFYILDNFNRMEDRLPSIIGKNLPLLESDWIISRMEKLLANTSQPFSPERMYLSDGSLLDPKRIQGKTLLIHFWISGCKFCLEEHQRVMADLSEKYKDREDILILTVNGDAKKENWLKSLASGKYTSESALNTWVPRNTGILQTYSIYSFPQKMMVSKTGKVQLQSIVRLELQDWIEKLEEKSHHALSTYSTPKL